MSEVIQIVQTEKENKIVTPDNDITEGVKKRFTTIITPRMELEMEKMSVTEQIDYLLKL